jgi:hypothetical protein
MVQNRFYDLVSSWIYDHPGYYRNENRMVADYGYCTAAMGYWLWVTG